MGLKENVIIGKLIPARAPIDLPPPPVKEIPLPESLQLEDGDDLFGDDDEIAGLLGSLPLDEPEDDGDIGGWRRRRHRRAHEPTPADLLGEDDVLEIEIPVAAEVPKGYVAEPDESSDSAASVQTKRGRRWRPLFVSVLRDRSVDFSPARCWMSHAALIAAGLRRPDCSRPRQSHRPVPARVFAVPRYPDTPRRGSRRAARDLREALRDHLHDDVAQTLRREHRALERVSVWMTAYAPSSAPTTSVSRSFARIWLPMRRIR